MRRLIPFLTSFAWIMQAAAQPPRLTVFAAARLSEAMRAMDQARVAKDHPQQIDLKPGFDPAGLLGRTVRDPAHVPAGRFIGGPKGQTIFAHFGFTPG